MKIEEFYSKSGEGPNLLFLHGWMQDRHTWDGIVGQLSHHFTCWTLDMPGFGNNPKPDSVWSPRDYANWIANFIKEHKIAKPTVIGHSFGGRVAIVLANTPHPAGQSLWAAPSPLPQGEEDLGNFEISKLILYATPGLKPPLTWSQKFSTALAKAVRKSKLPKEKLPFYRSIKEKLSSEDFKQAKELKDIFTATINYNLALEMTQIKTPTLLIWGDNDSVVPPKIGEAMAKIIPGSTLKLIPYGSHFAHLENPGLFCGLIRKFIDG